MAISKRLFKGRETKPASASVELNSLLAWMNEDVPRWASVTVEPDLVRARLADACRDANVAPLTPKEFDTAAQSFDAEAWRRLALIVNALDFDPLHAQLPLVLRAPAPQHVAASFLEFAKSSELLTLELLRQSPLRVEEFTRSWLQRLGASIVGESDAQSRQRLERLDYGRLLAEAETARESAEERMAYLRKLQEERASQRGRRGKW